MGSEKLVDQELRNAVYRGSYNTMSKTLAATPLVLKVMGLRRPHPRYADCQLLLRFFALLRATPYRMKGSMKQLLNRELEQYRNLCEAELQTMRATLERTMEIA